MGFELESPTLQILYRLSHQGSPEFVTFCQKLKMKVFFSRWRSGKESTSPVQEMQEIWVWSLNQEDPLEKEMATHSSILTQEILWMGETGGLQSMGSQGHDLVTKQQQQTIKAVENQGKIVAYWSRKGGLWLPRYLVPWTHVQNTYI